jgi:hypothetical protein
LFNGVYKSPKRKCMSRWAVFNGLEWKLLGLKCNLDHNNQSYREIKIYIKYSFLGRKLLNSCNKGQKNIWAVLNAILITAVNPKWNLT